MKSKYFLVVVFVFGFLMQTSAQKSAVKTFFNIPRPEKCWVITHPFKAKKAFVVSKQVKQKADSIKTTNLLDGNANGGQVDAFRHAYWMAMLSSKIGTRASVKLGKAHEKGNYIYYKKNKKEDGDIPDEISSVMDLCNNNVGIKIYEKNIGRSKKEFEEIIIKQIQEGNLFIIKTNKNGDFLDCKGGVISKNELQGKWSNKKCLVNSNNAIIN